MYNVFQRKKIAVYTAITNDYDHLRVPKIQSKDIDFFCFTDNSNLKSEKWKIIKMDDKECLDPIRQAKKVKVLPHLYFSDYEFSLWVDANFLILSDIQNLFNTFLKEASIACYKHPHRNCIYQEAEVCIQLKKDKRSIIDNQIFNYRSLNYPESNGLIASGIILRKHNDAHLIQLCEDWWREILQFSVRDQLSFNYVAWKNNINYTVIHDNIFDNNHFEWGPHQKEYFSED